MSQSTQDGDELNGDASDVIAPREGGLQPAAMGRGGAGRGGGQTPTAAERQRKSREKAKALRALSSAVTAGAAGGLAVQGAAAAPAQMVADAVASPGEESPTEHCISLNPPRIPEKVRRPGDNTWVWRRKYKLDGATEIRGTNWFPIFLGT